MTRKSGSRTKSKTDDRPLARYRSMRDFQITGEPSGDDDGISPSAGAPVLAFVIQKHAATRLHYDFRLTWNGVLKSWAITKGPSYFPGDKRLAVQVEDHPVEYGGFEGIIPKGQYGGGTVMLWDRGTWEPHVNVDEGLKNGSLKFALHGEKMKGNWALIRMGGRAANEAKPNWLLIKEHDAEEHRQDHAPVTEELPNSVLSGRNMDAIARAEDRVWNSNRARPGGTERTAAQVKRPHKAQDWSQDLGRSPKEALPLFVAPQLATLAKAPPAGDRWVHELKLDGYRIQARIDRKKSGVRMLTRTGLDWTQRMKSLADVLLDLPVESALIDGEVVVLTADGTSSFAELQTAFQEGSKHALTYFAFDLLHLDGHNLRGLSLIERKRILGKILSKANVQESVRLSEHLAGDAEKIFRKACELGTEGIVSKVEAAKYESGRGGNWVKIKCHYEQEFVIGGFTLPANGTHGVGALLLGYYRDGAFVYAGRTGTGFTQKTHRMLRDRLDKIHRASSPFVKIPVGAGAARWVKPQLVAQVSFSTWTADNLVRQAAFKGLRDDKPAESVRREVAKAVLAEASGSKSARASSSRAPQATVTRQAPGGEALEKLPIRLTHPDKIIDATTGVTKESLARYYMAVSAFMLPYVAHRPLTLVRCLEGTGRPCFYQKHKNRMLSGSFGSIDVIDKKTGKSEPYITLSTREAIVELAQIGVLELHPWGSLNEHLEQPDRIIFDLDPDDAIGWKTIAASALEIRKRLKALGLESFVKTTGGKGLHVVVPIRAEHSWPVVKEFAHKFVLGLERDDPSLFLTKMTKAARKRKIYLDYLRNERGATAVAPFSPRARAGLPVALPLSWSELGAEDQPRFLMSEFELWKKRLARDPWKGMPVLEQGLQLT